MAHMGMIDYITPLLIDSTSSLLSPSRNQGSRTEIPILSIYGSPGNGPPSLGVPKSPHGHKPMCGGKGLDMNNKKPIPLKALK